MDDLAGDEERQHGLPFAAGHGSEISRANAA
jgi:hypothetical protein